MPRRNLTMLVIAAVFAIFAFSYAINSTQY